MPSYLDRTGPDNKYILRNGSRAMHVTGEVMKGVSSEGRLRRVGTWLARVGASLSGLVEAAIPGTIPHMFGRHIGSLLAFVALLLIVLSFFAAPFRPLLAPAATLLAALVVIALAVFVLGSLMKSWNRILRFIVTIVLLILLASAGWAFVLGAKQLACEGRSFVQDRGWMEQPEGGSPPC